jgi:pilus assembly protein CpaC
MPEQKDIQVSAAGDTLVISGTVSDAPTAARVLDLAAALCAALRSAGCGGKAAPTPAPRQCARQPRRRRKRARIVNFLNIGAPQQVMLEVKIAEVSKSLLDQLEAGVTSTSAAAAGPARCRPTSSAAP